MKHWKTSSWAGLFLALLFLFVLTSGAGAAPTRQIVVKTFQDDAVPNGNCTLREAILAANSDAPVDQCQAGSGADTIVLPAGVYTLSVLGSGEDAGLTGDLDISAPATIRGQGPGVTIIQGFPDTLEEWERDRVFHILPTAGTVKIHNLAITGSAASVDGKAIFNQAALTLEDCRLSHNRAGQYEMLHGGAISNAGWMDLRRCQLENNRASYGGAIYNDGTLTVQQSGFLGNAADDDSLGGGIYNDGDLTVTASSLSANFAAAGAAIFNAANLTLLDSHLDGNSARFSAAALANTGQARLENTTANNNISNHSSGAIRNSGQLTLTGGSLSANRSYDYAGAIYQSAGQLTISGTEIRANQTDGSGGGLFIGGGRADLAGVTLADNRSTFNQGGAVYLFEGEIAIRDSRLQSNQVEMDGGGLYARSGSVTLERVQVVGNTAGQNGGGIYLEAGSLALVDSQVNQNAAYMHGGGIFSSASLDVTRSQVSDNYAEIDGAGIYSTAGLILTDASVSTNTGYGSGGGIYTTGSLLAVRSRINGNWGWGFESSSYDGGGGIFTTGQAHIEQCEISGNFTILDGGGISNSGTLTVLNSTVSGNWGRSWAGGIKHSGAGHLALVNVSFSHNQGDLGGGGVGIDGGSASLKHVTIFNNIDAIGYLGNTGGALEVYSGQLTIQNSIVAGNQVYGGGPLAPTVDCHLWPDALIDNLGYNLVGVTDGCNWPAAPGDLTGSLEAILDARLFDLGDFGGANRTAPPQFDSPALDAANPDACLPFDQRGAARPSGAGCDIGAVEAFQIAVAIDVKPNSSTNIIDRTSRGQVAVTLFSAPGFDALTGLDRATLTFGRSGSERSLFYLNGKAACAPGDLNRDGLPDLTCEFSIDLAAFQCGDTRASLRAYGFQKQLISGADNVRIVPCP